MTASASAVAIILPGASERGDTAFCEEAERDLCAAFQKVITGVLFVEQRLLPAFVPDPSMVSESHPLPCFCHQFPQFMLPVTHHRGLYRPTKAFKVNGKTNHVKTLP